MFRFRNFAPLTAAYGLAVTFLLLLGGLVLAGNANASLPIRAYSVRSGSMAPAVPTGSVVFVRAEAVYDTGDVITFRSPTGVPVTHRIVDRLTGAEATAPNAFRTQGDANEDPDLDPVTADMIIGRVFWHLPWLGYLLGAVGSPLGLMLLVVIPATLIIYHELRHLGAELAGLLHRLRNRHGRIVFETSARLRPSGAVDSPVRSHTVYRNGARERQMFTFPPKAR